MTLLSLPVVMLLAALVFHVCLLRATRTELQTGADAAALAAARELATDELLLSDPPVTGGRVGKARDAAGTLAAANLVAGKYLQLQPNPDNSADGDIVLGFMDSPLGTFNPATGSDPSSWSGTRLNAVHVTTRRSGTGAILGVMGRDAFARATAMLDFAVVGFRTLTDDPLPLVPVGVFTDHVGALPDSWDAKIARSPTDEWAFDPNTGQFIPGADGIPEVTVVIGGGESRTVAGMFLRLGAEAFRETAEQCRSGVRRSQLSAEIGGEFVLGPANTLSVHGSSGCAPTGTGARRLIETALEDIRLAGLPRVWPLFSGTDEAGTVQVCGWVAARLVAVGAHNGGLALTLQPTVFHHPSVVTERRTNPPAFWANNRTVCRVKLAE
ncbi:pilus assembly protein TadG-related protein [Fimbriiglobus ruber]|nr:pilus assembly protein TadG-related protein [Fimbriiglobus ruber]